MRGTGILPRSFFKKENVMIAQQYRRSSLPLMGTVLLGLLIGVYLFAWKRKRAAKRDEVIKHSVEKHPDEALKYWTVDKMRDAKPTPLPHVNGLDRGKGGAQSPSDK